MNKALARFAYCLLISVLILSCSKEDADDSNPVGSEAVFAGKYDSSFSYYDFDPDFQIPIVWDSLRLYGGGYDSLDLDSDGHFDLYVTLSLLNPDSMHLMNGLPNPFPFCRVETSGEFECAYYSESYPIGLGQTGTASFVDRLDFEERLDTLSDWRAQGRMWQENPGYAGNPPFGEWAFAVSTHYIGIKNAENKYGWIEVDASDPENLSFLSCAFQE